MNIIDVARQYFTLKIIGNGVYQIVNPTGKFDSVVLWEKTNSYHRFSNGKSGGVKEFLKYICGVNVDNMEFEDDKNDILHILAPIKNNKENTDLSLLDVVADPVYNNYIQSRMINEITAKHYKLETYMQDVFIPLYDENKLRVGSIIRNGTAQSKTTRYKTHLIGAHKKPCCWRFPDLYEVNRNSVIVLVEGAWSVMRIHQVIKPIYPQVVPIATLGTTITDELKAYLGNNKIITILDDDAGGKHVETQMKQWSQTHKNIEIYIPSLPLERDKSNIIYVDDLSDKQLIKFFSLIKSNSNLLK